MHLYKNIISHTLFSKWWCWLCVRDELETGQTVILTQSSSFDPSSTSSSTWLGCSTVGHWGPKALCLPLALNSAFCLQLTQAVCVLVMLLFNVHLLPLFFRLFTQVHLLIDGSVEGQYVTMLPAACSRLCSRDSAWAGVFARTKTNTAGEVKTNS